MTPSQAEEEGPVENGKPRPGRFPFQWSAWKRLLEASQIRRILGVALGAASAQAALLLASPVLTRMYTPDDFGVYSYFFATLGFLAPVSTLRYELAIPLPQSETNAEHVGMASLAAALVMGGVVLAGLGVGLWLEVDVLLNASASFLIGLPIGVTLSGFYQTFTYWAVRHERFRAIALARGSLGAGTSVAQILFGLPIVGSIGLILGDLAGRLCSVGLLARSLAETVGRAARSWSPRAVLARAKEYRGFALLSCPSALINSLALFLPLFAVGHFFGSASAGWLFLAQRVIGLPATLLTSATAQVYIGEFTKIDRTERPSLYGRTLRRLAALTVVPFILGALASPLIFPIIFGDEWTTAGRLGMLLAPYYFFQLLSGSTVSTLDTMELHGARLLREATFLLLTVGAFAIPFVTEIGLETLVGIYSVVGSLFYGGSIVFVRLLMARPSG